MRRRLDALMVVVALVAATDAVAADLDEDRWQRLSVAGVEAADAGEAGKAEALLRQAYALAVALPESDPRRATSASNLGYVLAAEGRPQEALPLDQEALHGREASLGPGHPSVAQSLSNLAEALRALKRDAEAEPLQRRALAIREASLGPSHPETAQSLNNLGVLLAGLGRGDEAEPLYRQALAIRLKAFGPAHSAVAESEINLAALAVARGEDATAERLYRDVLAMPKQRPEIGDGPSVALAAAALGAMLLCGGHAADAVPFLERALAARQPGPASEAVAARTQRDLAAALAATGELQRAQALLEASLPAQERLTGVDSAEVAAILADLAEVLRRRDQPTAAAPLLARAVAIEERASSGGQTLALATMLNNLAALRYQAGAYRDAAPLLARALDLEEKAGGPDDAGLALTLENYAAVLGQLERVPEADAARHRAAAIRLLASAGRPAP